MLCMYTSTIAVFLCSELLEVLQSVMHGAKELKRNEVNTRLDVNLHIPHDFSCVLSN